MVGFWCWLYDDDDYGGNDGGGGGDLNVGWLHIICVKI